jgi:hypothetical protein
MPLQAQKLPGQAGGYIPGIGQVNEGKPETGDTARIAFPAVGQVKFFHEENDSLAVLCDLGDSPPRIVGGYGQWDQVARRGRTSLTTFAGYGSLEVEIECFIDQYGAFNDDPGVDVETALAKLELMAGRGRGNVYAEPPKLKVDTAGVLSHDYTHSPAVRWVITDLEWDDDGAIINQYGNRVRQPVTVRILEYVTDDRLKRESRKASQKAKAPSSTKTVTVKSGDTLMTIARDRLGDAGRWQELARLNSIRDPRKLKTGQKIKLP